MREHETSAAALLNARGIEFAYGARTILDGVDFHLERGQVIGLLGPNGTGKSTLLGVLAGDLPASAGSVEICGRDLGQYSRKELATKRAVMPQNHDFPFAYLTRDIVAMGRLCWAGSARAVDDEGVIATAMRRTDIVELADRDVTQLSGGEKARVTLARVLAQETPIVFLDEPTAALDVLHQQQTMRICRELAVSGAGVVAVMHDIQLAASSCDLIALMSGGKICAFGTPEQVLTAARLTEVYRYPLRVLHLDSGEIVVLPQREDR